MLFGPCPKILKSAVLGAGALLVLSFVSRAGKILPAWELAGLYDVDVPAGFESLSSRYAFDLGTERALVSFVYDGKGGVFGSTILFEAPAGITVLQLAGSFDVDETGTQTVRLAEAVKRPGFRFEGSVEPATGNLVGTYEQSDGFAGFSGDRSGPFTILRSDPAPRDDAFDLQFTPLQSTKGAVRGMELLPGAKQSPESTASLIVYGGTELFDGKIRGRVRTKKDGTTTGKLRIKGRYRRLDPPVDGKDRERVKPWKVKLDGPVDVDGFHAVARIKAFGFDVSGTEITLPVVEGPPAPPPPPPPPPKNFLDGASAKVESGVVTIDHTSVPKRFFGARSTLRVRFPFSDGLDTVNAVPATFPGPIQRQVIVNLGAKTYSTQNDPADVAIEIKALDNTQNGLILIRLTGVVYRDNGKSKTVDVDLRALVE